MYCLISRQPFNFRVPQQWNKFKTVLRSTFYVGCFFSRFICQPLIAETQCVAKTAAQSAANWSEADREICGGGGLSRATHKSRVFVSAHLSERSFKNALGFSADVAFSTSSGAGRETAEC